MVMKVRWVRTISEALSSVCITILSVYTELIKQGYGYED